MSIETRLQIPAFEGEVLTPADPEYEAARRVENDAIDRRPAAIARCVRPGDVAAAISYARGRGLPLTVRAGGHGRDGFAVADDVLTVDLTRMSAVTVDPARRRARVQGGATWRELDAATAAHGLGVTGARLPSVGVAGFTLGSGSGWLERRQGLAADALRAARVATAAGELVSADRSVNADLFWALRGGGPSFGVAVELEFELQPVGELVGGMLAWDVDRAADVGDAYAALMAAAPDDLGGALALTPEAMLGGPMVAAFVLWTGAAHDATEALAPLRALRPEIDRVQRMPYSGLQRMFESPERFTARIHGEGGFFDRLSGELVAVLAEQQARKPAPQGSLLVQPLGGAFARRADGEIPLGQRDARWAWQAGAAWFDPAADEAVARWAEGLRAALAPWSRGEAYPNFIPEADPARLRRSYGDAVWRRLQAIRSEWDPDDVFSAGQAIPLP